MAAEAQALAQLRAAVLRGDIVQAEHHALAGLREHPQSLELRRALAGIFRQTRRDVQAQTLLREVLRAAPQDDSAAFTLAEICIEQGRMHAAATALCACFAASVADANLAIRAIEMLADAQRQREAASIALSALASHPSDARLHAYAGMLLVQTGDFARAREHYLYALQNDARACEWNAALGLSSAQRYENAEHPDFVLFDDSLARKDLSDKARTSVLFALGKAHDDIGDYAHAADYFRQANARAHAATAWSRKTWQRAVESRLASKPYTQHLEAANFVPVFIVGMPRSGTTLVAQRLARYAGMCNRGELPWLAKLALLPVLAGNPPRDVLERCAAIYAAQLRQDDAGDARFFIDKQPLNFRYVDLMLALWPNAKIIHCRRGARDTALSLWSQWFMEDVQAYAYAFEDIAVVMRDCERLMAHWQARYPQAIREVRYEALIAQPEAQIALLAQWIGLPADHTAPADAVGATIGTASLWQARQPIYTRSIGRWRNYAPFVPELERFAES